jgi:hypothetical protein
VTFRAEHVRQAIQDFDFPRLFIEELGWDSPPANQSVEVEDGRYELRAVADKSGMVAFVNRSEEIPDRAVRMKIERQLAKAVYEHLLVFTDADQTTQVWQWVRRQRGQTPRYREHSFHREKSGEPLVQKLQLLAFSFDEEPSTAEVAGRARQAFDVDRVTRRFYDKFKSEHTTFQEFLEDAIPLEKDREVYASVMLDRLMFVYFIQKKGFLDDDYDYLRTRLKQVQRLRGQGQFISFYRCFLRRFFHEGLGQQEIDRDPALIALIGNVPYLNGGIFDPHELERRYPKIQVDDLAFVRLFDFFDRYDWHLDERPLRSDREINPDVLGYIFEKHINQKQMGAYYTKEDITGYIARNTVIPRLFDMARNECNKECKIAFQPDSALWRLLSENPDRYIYPSVSKGVDRPLPDEIAAGREYVARRVGWNTPAEEAYALPTETWREHVARRGRYEEVWEKLVVGQVHRVDDLITLNLDIRQFAQDAIRYCECPELLRAFWKAICNVSVLDPACGSGAFLFAALNVLEPLYDSCLERMEAFLDELDNSDVQHSPAKFSDFREHLAEVDLHPNRRYYILKSIVIGNLYGVDIMEEAVDICKLRLFLKLVAQADTLDELEPLPDIDFNVRDGNTLVGFTSLDAVRQAMAVEPNGQQRQLFDEEQGVLDRIEDEAKVTNFAFEQFRKQQTELGGEITAEHKADLRRRLAGLGNELNRYLATEYDLDPSNPAEHNTDSPASVDCDLNLGSHNAYECWKTSHQPFHWFVEFYGIMNTGGFDAVVGNPPFVETRNLRDQYTIDELPLAKTRNLFAIFGHRSSVLNHQDGRLGLIFPISAISTPRMLPLMKYFQASHSQLWLANFAVRPSKLFYGADMNLTILISGRKSDSQSSNVYATEYVRWHEQYRRHLFDNLAFFDSYLHNKISTMPKLGSQLAGSILDKIRSHVSLKTIRSTHASADSVYYHSGGRYFRKCLDEKLSNEYKELRIDPAWKSALISLLSSSIYYWYWIVHSDCYHVTRRDIDGFYVPSQLADDCRLKTLSDRLLQDLWQNAEVRSRSRADGTVQREVNFQVGKSKSIIDDIDAVLATHYGFTDEELDFVVNFDGKYRLSS